MEIGEIASTGGPLIDERGSGTVVWRSIILEELDVGSGMVAWRSLLGELDVGRLL